MGGETTCDRCGYTCMVDGEPGKNFAYCDKCKAPADGFDSHEHFKKVFSSVGCADLAYDYAKDERHLLHLKEIAERKKAAK